MYSSSFEDDCSQGPGAKEHREGLSHSIRMQPPDTKALDLWPPVEEENGFPMC